MTLGSISSNSSYGLLRTEAEPILSIALEGWMPELSLECGKYRVKRTSTLSDEINATTLIKRMYSRRGYLTESESSAPKTPERLTIDAHVAHQTVGTLSVGLDSSGGLLADGLYRAEIDRFRKEGRTPSEICKLAMDPEHGSKELFASLIQVAYLYIYSLSGSDLFIEVHPRHSGFYKRMLGFKEIGEQRICPRVNAPAILLHIELEYMQTQISAYGGQGGMGRERSLYPYFSNCGAEQWISRLLPFSLNPKVSNRVRP